MMNEHKFIPVPRALNIAAIMQSGLINSLCYMFEVSGATIRVFIWGSLFGDLVRPGLIRLDHISYKPKLRY